MYQLIYSGLFVHISHSIRTYQPLHSDISATLFVHISHSKLYTKRQINSFRTSCFLSVNYYNLQKQRGVDHLRKKEVAKESNKIARAKISPPPASVWEERIIALVTAKNKDADRDFSLQTIPVTELTGEKKLSNEQRKKIISSVRNLGRTIVELKTKKGEGILVMPIFSIIGVNDNGTIVAQLNKALKDYFLNLNSGEFTLLCLPEFRQLTSIYSQILYRYLLSWRAKGVVVVKIDELHDVLGVPQV